MNLIRIGLLFSIFSFFSWAQSPTATLTGTAGRSDLRPELYGSPAFKSDLRGRVGFTRTTPYNTTRNIGQDYAAEMGIRGVTTDPAAVGFPRFVVTNLVRIGDNFNSPTFTTINGSQYSGALTWVRGNHTLKAGAEALHSQNFAPNYSRARGYFKPTACTDARIFQKDLA